METKEIIKQIEKLPVAKRILVVEHTLKSIREKELKEKLTKAVKDMQEDYKINSDLTAFTDIDFEEFYEAR